MAQHPLMFLITTGFCRGSRQKSAYPTQQLWPESLHRSAIFRQYLHACPWLPLVYECFIDKRTTCCVLLPSFTLSSRHTPANQMQWGGEKINGIDSRSLRAMCLSTRISCTFLS